MQNTLQLSNLCYGLQCLLKEKCLSDEKLFASFLNRLFNTLNWTITEFSVAIKEMQEHLDLRQVHFLFKLIKHAWDSIVDEKLSKLESNLLLQ